MERTGLHKQDIGDAGRPALAPHVLGILCVLGAVVIFSIQDMVIKWFSDRYALHEIVFIRAFVAMCVTLAVFVPLEGGFGILRSRRWPLHLLRGFSIVVGNLLMFAGLASMPLSEGVAIFFVAPLFITLLSVPVLGEKIGVHRMMAVIIGFCGVLVMIRPGSASFQIAALLPLGAALAYASLQMMTRKLGLAEKASTMAFYIQVMFLSSSALMWLMVGDGRFAGSDNPSIEFLLRAWVWPSPVDGAIMVAIGCINALGGYLISQGYRVAEAGLVAPFEYVAVPLSIVWSVLIWGDWPDLLAWVGIALIVGGGLYVVYRETIRGRRVDAVRAPR